jgi:hypothetical protein
VEAKQLTTNGFLFGELRTLTLYVTTNNRRAREFDLEGISYARKLVLDCSVRTSRHCLSLLQERRGTRRLCAHKPTVTLVEGVTAVAGEAAIAASMQNCRDPATSRRSRQTPFK